MLFRPALLVLLIAGCQASTVAEPPGPPTSPTVAIEPAAPTSADDLIAVVTAPSVSQDGAPVGYAFAWSVDDQPRNDLTGPVVPAAATTRGQRWSVTVTPVASGAPVGPEATAQVEVLNAPPIITGGVTPEEPTALDDLVARIEAVDPDGDLLDLRLVWTLDGSPLDGVGNVIPASETQRGERYVLTATATDSEGAETVVTFERPIRNSQPRAHAVAITPEAPFVSDDLHASASVYDADGDPVTLTWIWRVDGVDVLASASPTLPARSFAKHQEVTVEVVPNDGLDAGPGVLSAPVRVLNTPPSTPGIRIGPGLPSPDEPLTCEVVEPSLDPDGDTLTYRFVWTVDGEPFEGATDEALTSTIAPADLALHQLWTCEVIPEDDEVAGVEIVRRKQIGVPGKRLAVAQQHTCGIRDDAALFCWGDNSRGQLGDGTFERRTRPTRIAPELEWADVAGGQGHTCAVTVDGELYCWGENNYGQLGDGTRELRWTPVLVDAEQRWEHVVAGSYFTCARTIEGEAWCWGANWSGFLGDGSTRERLRPSRVAGSYRWTSLTIGEWHTCGITGDAEILCWGSNNGGTLGDGTFDDSRSAPGWVLSDEEWASVAAGPQHTCGVTIDDRVRCWGRNDYGRLGDGTYLDRATPRAPTGDPTFTSVYPGYVHTCALDPDGDVWCWGENWYGAFGDGTSSGSMAPVRTITGYEWSDLFFGHYHACGFTEDEELFCWGAGWNGQLGDGTTASRQAPIRISLD